MLEVGARLAGGEPQARAFSAAQVHPPSRRTGRGCELYGVAGADVRSGASAAPFTRADGVGAQPPDAAPRVPAAPRPAAPRSCSPAAVAALVWANVDAASYERVWTTSSRSGSAPRASRQDLRDWVNSGLMTFFFFVVGLEARREFDLGELRERRRVALPLAGRHRRDGSCRSRSTSPSTPASRRRTAGASAMSTDTAFALGMLALVGPRLPDRLRAFMLTVVVVDDIVALLVIAIVYTRRRRRSCRCSSPSGSSAAPARVRASACSRGSSTRCSASPSGSRCSSRASTRSSSAWRWACSAYAYPARADRPGAGDRPVPAVPRAADRRSWRGRRGRASRSAISPNERLQQLYHPWTSYVIVPLFALANAGIAIDGGFLAPGLHLADHARDPGRLRASASRSASSGAGWLVTRLSRGRLRPPVGWAAVVGGGTIAGIGFTVVAADRDARLHGQQLEEAKLGVLSARARAPSRADLVAVPGDRAAAAPAADPGAARHAPSLIVDLAVPVDPERDHIRGPPDAPVTWSSTATSSARTAARPSRSSASCSPTSATSATCGGTCRSPTSTRTRSSPPRRPRRPPSRARSGRCTTCCSTTRTRCRRSDLVGYAERARPRRGALRRRTCATHVGAARVAEDVDSADLSGVSGTPTFFINGRRHYGAYDIETLSAAVKSRARAGARAPTACMASADGCISWARVWQLSRTIASSFPSFSAERPPAHRAHHRRADQSTVVVVRSSDDDCGRGERSHLTLTTAPVMALRADAARVVSANFAAQSGAKNWLSRRSSCTWDPLH